MILADTSIWIEHFRSGDTKLVKLLEAGQILVHPCVIGELACGNLHRRAEILNLLHHLPAAPVATDREALTFIEARRLMGRGIGYIDVHLLAAVALTPGVQLWTRDKHLATIAHELGLGEPA
jgi:predicted nucleic acid-binding protein